MGKYISNLDSVSPDFQTDLCYRRLRKFTRGFVYLFSFKLSEHLYLLLWRTGLLPLQYIWIKHWEQGKERERGQSMPPVIRKYGERNYHQYLEIRCHSKTTPQKLSFCGFKEASEPSKGLEANQEIPNFWLCTMSRITSPGFTEEFRGTFDTHTTFRQLVAFKGD